MFLIFMDLIDEIQLCSPYQQLDLNIMLKDKIDRSSTKMQNMLKITGNCIKRKKGCVTALPAKT